MTLPFSLLINQSIVYAIVESSLICQVFLPFVKKEPAQERILHYGLLVSNMLICLGDKFIHLMKHDQYSGMHTSNVLYMLVSAAYPGASPEAISQMAPTIVEAFFLAAG